MKRLPVVILVVLAVLGVVVSGCESAHRYDSRLTAVDSLMRSAPDSALAMVEAISRDSLTSEGDRAYCDLLLTQARYKAYVTATSDSDINRALAWYRAHPADREKLTRAYIYKGAVMEELGHPDSAMLYYKTAEATAAPDDYFNLGYAKLRIGALYRDNYAMDGRQIIEFEKALDYFNNTDNVDYQLTCLINLGSLCCLHSPQKADSLLNKALSVAKMQCDTMKYILAMQNLIKKDIYLRHYEDAHQHAVNMLSMNSQFIDATFCIYAADAYACLQMPDSAEILLKMADERIIDNEIDRVAYINVMKDIAIARGNLRLSEHYEKLSLSIEDSLYTLDPRIRISKIEKTVEEESQNLLLKQHDSLIGRVSLLLISALVLLALSVYIFIKKHSYKILAIELSRSYESQYQELKELHEKIKAMDIRDGELKDFITSNIDMMREMIDECYHGASVLQIKQKIEKIVRYQKGKNTQWLKFFSYIDYKYGNIISITRNSFPHLDEKDLMLLALSTLDCSCIQIATILGYSNVSSIGPIRQRLAKKMKLDGPLNQYIQQFKST